MGLRPWVAIKRQRFSVAGTSALTSMAGVGDLLLLVDDAAQVGRGLAVGGTPTFRVVHREDLCAVSLALGNHADVEARVEELGRRELSQRQDGSIEVEISPGGPGRGTPLCRADGEHGPTIASAEGRTDVGVGGAARGRRTGLAGWPRRGRSWARRNRCCSSRLAIALTRCSMYPRS